MPYSARCRPLATNCLPVPSIGIYFMIPRSSTWPWWTRRLLRLLTTNSWPGKATPCCSYWRQRHCWPPRVRRVPRCIGSPFCEKLNNRQCCNVNGLLLGLASAIILRPSGIDDRKGSSDKVAECFEAVLGAVYVDGGLDAVRGVYHRHCPPDPLRPAVCKVELRPAACKVEEEEEGDDDEIESYNIEVVREGTEDDVIEVVLEEETAEEKAARLEWLLEQQAERKRRKLRRSRATEKQRKLELSEQQVFWP